MISQPERTVFKLGGSLLHTPDWPARLHAWFNHQSAGEYFGIVGGGMLMNALRQLDDLHSLSQVAMHWRCIGALDATYDIAAEMIPSFNRIDSYASLQSNIDRPFAGDGRRSHWVRIGAFYSLERLEETESALHPAIGWNTTSDSLALFLAHRIGAERCVLLKSCPVDHVRTLAQAVQEKIVDSECMRFHGRVPTIELVQL